MYVDHNWEILRPQVNQIENGGAMGGHPPRKIDSFMTLFPQYCSCNLILSVLETH